MNGNNSLLVRIVVKSFQYKLMTGNQRSNKLLNLDLKVDLEFE
jgi:hypothetical protein